MASEDFTEHLTGDADVSEEKPEAVELSKLDTTEASLNETNPQNSLMEGRQMELEEVEMHQEKMEEDLDLRPQSDVDQGNGPEKVSLTNQDEEEDCVQEHDEQKDAGKLDKSNAEDTAHSSEELVIAKVEDFTNEMAIDVDKTEDRDGRRKVDRPEDAGRWKRFACY